MFAIEFVPKKVKSVEWLEDFVRNAIKSYGFFFEHDVYSVDGKVIVKVLDDLSDRIGEATMAIGAIGQLLVVANVERGDFGRVREIGEVYGYKKCCIDSFIKKATFGIRTIPWEEETIEYIWRGTGYVPCDSCKEETNGMNKEEFTNWFGRDLFDDALVERTFGEKLKKLEIENEREAAKFNEWNLKNAIKIEVKHIHEVEPRRFNVSFFVETEAN